jgi:peroxiredoxin
MKTIKLISAFILCCFTVIPINAQKSDSKIIGKLRELSQDKIYLCKSNDPKKGTFVKLDSAICNSQGNFSIDLNKLEPGKYELRMVPKLKIDLFYDGSTDIVATIGKNASESKISAGRADSLIRRFDQVNMNIAFTQLGLAMTNQKYQQKGEKMPDSLLNPMINMYEMLNKQKDELCKQALEKPDFSIIYIVLNGGCLDKYSNKELNESWSRLSDNIKSSQIGKDFKMLLDRYNNLSEGGRVPDFTETAPDGKQVRLYDFIKGKKVVLIDFWASWCGPCRKENKNVVKIYDEFRGKGFEIISISLDSDRAKWLEAIEADKLIWHHVSDLGGWKEKTAQEYKVTAVPATFLIDGKGNVIARNLRGEELKKRVEELCSKKVTE